MVTLNCENKCKQKLKTAVEILTMSYKGSCFLTFSCSPKLPIMLLYMYRMYFMETQKPVFWFVCLFLFIIS